MRYLNNSGKAFYSWLHITCNLARLQMEAIALCGTRVFLQAVTEAHVGTAEPAPGGLTLRVLALHTAAQLKAPSSCLHISQWRQHAMQEPNGATCLAIQRHLPTSAISITLKYLILSVFSHAQMFKYITYFMKHINAVSLHKPPAILPRTTPSPLQPSLPMACSNEPHKTCIFFLHLLIVAFLSVPPQCCTELQPNPVCCCVAQEEQLS